MGAYMYPIKVDKTRKVIKYVVSTDITDVKLTLDFLAKYIYKQEWFNITEYEENQFGTTIMLNVHKQRKETDEEFNTRVNKELAYMVEYNKRQIK